MIKKLDAADALIFYQKWYDQTNTPERLDHITKTQDNRRFFYSDQWDKTKQEEKSEIGQYMISLNRTKKYIEGQIGLLTGSTPTVKVHPFGPEDAMMSDIANIILANLINNASERVMHARILTAGAAENLAYGMVKVNKLGKVCVDCLYNEEAMPNTEAKDPFFRDAETFYIEKYVSVKKVAAMFNIPETELSGEYPIEWSGKVNSDGLQSAISKVYDKHKNFVKVIETYNKEYETIFNIDPETKEKVPSGDFKVKIVKRIIIGYNHCWEETLPEKITVHNLIPFYCVDTANIYKLGSLEFIKEQQKLLNASFGIMLLNAQMSSSAKVLIPEDAIPDNDVLKFKANFAKVGSINVTKGDGKEYGEIKVIQPIPLSNAYYQLTTMMMQEMEFNMVPNQLLGMDMSQNNQTSNVFKNYEVMLNSMRTMFTIYEGYFSVLGKAMLQYFFAYTPKEKIFRLCGADKMLVELQSAIDGGLDISNDQTVQDWLAQREEAGDNPHDLKRFISELTYKTKFINTLNEMCQSTEWTDYDIVIEQGSYVPSYTMMRFFMKLELYKQNIIDNETVLEDLPLANKEQVISRVSHQRLLEEENAELKGALKKLTDEMNMMKDAVVKGEVSMMQQQHELKMDKEYNDTRQKNQTARKQQSSQFRTVMSEDRMRLKQQADELFLELRYAIAENKLKQMSGKNESRKIELPSMRKYLDSVVEEERIQ